LTSIAVFSAVLTLSIAANAQKVKLQSGDLSVLKNESTINFEFTYENMGVGKYKDEAEYVAKKTEDYNKKQAGRGDAWARAWVADRKERFEPRFIELFGKYSSIFEKKDSKYTIIFNTRFIEPGYNVYVSRENAKISGDATIVETADHSKVIAVVSIDKAPGRTFGGDDYDTGTRLSEAYADAGKALAKLIKK